MKIFEYALIHHGKKTKKDEDGGTAPKHTILKGVTQVLAKDEDQARIMAARQIPDEYMDKLDEIEVAIRPF